MPVPIGWDRTNEFKNLVEDFKFSSNNVEKVANHAETETEFSKEASAIGNELNITQGRISELRRLVKQRGIFDDRTTEIQSSAFNVRQNVMGLSGRIDALARNVPSTTTTTTHDAAHYRSVIQALRTRLGEAAMDMKLLLEQRASTMKLQESRRAIYSHNPGLVSRRQQAMSQDDNASSSLDLEGGGLLSQQFQPRQSLYHNARLEAVESVQRMIGELAQIFNRVANLVSAQEELTIRIEDDMCSSLHNLEQGEAQLLKYLRSVTSNRSLIIKVFAILMCFVIFFVMFLSG